MNKLTADKCRELISNLHRCRSLRIISTREEKYLEALEIALTVLEQQEKGNDGWVEWHGGDCPVGGACQVKLRAGLELTGPATSFLWWHDGDFDDGDIIAYRVIENDGREG